MSNAKDTYGLMFAVKNDGSESVCQHDSRVLSFVFNGVSITNPFLDESTVVSADPRHYGFVEVDIGGITALRLDLPEAGHFLLTDETGARLPDGESIDRNRLSYYSNGKLQAYCFIGDIPL